MRNFLTLFVIFFKNRFKSSSFITASLLLISFVCCFALLCPSPAPASAIVGLIYDETDSLVSRNFEPLLELTEITFIRYPQGSEEQLAYDVIGGRLHIGYSIDMYASAPIKVYETKSSVLAPITDELVFSSWFNAKTEAIASGLYGGRHSELIQKELYKRQLSDRSLSADITIRSSSSGKSEDFFSLTAVIYAVIIPLLILCSAFCAMLSPSSEHQTVTLLQKSAIIKKLHTNDLLSHHLFSVDVSFTIPVARFAAHAALFFCLMLCCETVISFCIVCSYSIAARVIAAAITALLASAVFSTFCRVRATSSVLMLLIMWCAVSIVFSGAVLTPELIPGFGWFRFISPSWLLLQLMTIIG